MSASNDDQQLRGEAEKSLKRKRDFRNFAFIYIVVNLILIGVWAFSGGGYFWPIWTIFGMGIALVFSAWDAYGSGKRSPTDADIEKEMRRIKGNDN